MAEGMIQYTCTNCKAVTSIEAGRAAKVIAADTAYCAVCGSPFHRQFERYVPLSKQELAAKVIQAPAVSVPSRQEPLAAPAPPEYVQPSPVVTDTPEPDEEAPIVKRRGR